MGRAKIAIDYVYFYSRGGLARFLPSAREDALYGPDALRVQLHSQVLPHLPSDVDFGLVGVSAAGRFRNWNVRRWIARQRPSVVLLARTIAYRLKPDEIRMLREKAIAVGVDHKDGDLSSVDLSLFDFHVSSSMAGAAALRAILESDLGDRGRDTYVGLLFQGHDTRLDGFRPRPLDHFAPVYVGDAKNAALPPVIRDQIPMIQVTWSRDMKAAIERLPEFNFHFAARPEEGHGLRRRYKPFTKGANAAACFSNILINEQVDDATAFLGHDYPYLVASNRAPDVEDGFRRARDGYGGPEWRLGLEIMQTVRERVAAPALARQIVEIATRAAA